DRALAGPADFLLRPAAPLGLGPRRCPFRAARPPRSRNLKVDTPLLGRSLRSLGVVAIDWRGTPRGCAPRPALRSAERARCDARTPGPQPCRARAASIPGGRKRMRLSLRNFAVTPRRLVPQCQRRGLRVRSPAAPSLL